MPESPIPASVAETPPGSITGVLDQLAERDDALASPRITAGEVVDALRERGFGLLFVLLAIPNAVPGPAMPGLSTLTGLPLAFVALELALGRDEPDLPGCIRRRSMSRAGFRRLVARLRPTLLRLEAIVRPRYPRLTTPRAERLLGAFGVFAALVLAVPLPTANLVMGWGVAALGLGLMERDGGAIALGIAICLLGTAWSALLFWLGGETFAWLGRMVGW
ncbi:MAG: exopolysaccharide biosynthesis protein [Alphaproteobacteria bacterium]|nr:exopolysaccharide biosynthesis protein [Alphaproteobacteria bacterium]